MKKSVKILIIEDELEIQEIIKLQLDSQEYEFYIANNGIEGLEILKIHAVDLIISDLAMPKMNGFEFLRKLKNLNLNIQIIILTGHTDNLVANQLRPYGVKYFLNKPWRRAELMECVSESLKNKNKNKKVC